MAHRVGDYLKQDPLKLRFTSSNPSNNQPKSIVKRALNQSVAEITQTNYYTQYPNVIVYYELLDISIIELETKKSLKVIWTGRNNKEESTMSYLLPKTYTFNDVAEHMTKNMKIQPGGSGKIRIFDISQSGRSQREYTGSEMIGNLTDPAELFAEVCSMIDHADRQEVPMEELQAGDNAKIVPVFHFARETNRTHGVPCRFVLYEV